MIVVQLIETVGHVAMRPVTGLGRFSHFAYEAIRRLLPMRVGLVIRQLEFVGNRSIGVICLAGSMIGGVFGLQLGKIFGLFGAESMLGAAASFALSRELAPVIGSFLVTGRAGSSMTAEIATMRVNEQIDAMRVMAVNPYNYLIAPRVLATTIMVPLLTGVFILCGVATAFVIGVTIYQVDQGLFFGKIGEVVKPTDLISGLQKAAVFGFLMSNICCFRGYHAHGGAKGVGRATTEAVVLSLVMILVFDFIIGFLQFQTT